MNKIHTIVIVLIGSLLLLIGCDMIVDRPPKSDKARPIGSDLIISEVYTISPSQNYSYSWIEILNPTNRTISWMSKATPATGYVVGEGGTILQTVDNGQTWRQLSSGTASNLYDVRFQGISKGWAVGDNGTILSTTDSGKTWSPQASGVTSSLLSVFAPPPGTSGSPMVVVGKGGAALWSVNNGTNWDTASPPPGTRRTLRAVQYFSNDGALGVPTLALGDMGSGVYVSANSGTNWTYASSNLPESYIFTSMAVAAGKVFAGTRGGGVFLSTDNGTNWTAVNSGLANTLVQTLLLSGSNLFAGTQSGVFLSTNNGTNWIAVNSGLTNTNVQAFAVSGANIFAGTQGGVFLSTNNGTGWTAINTGLTNTNVQALAASGVNVFAGTNGSGIFRSTDTGANWSIDTPGLNGSFNVKALIFNGANVFAGTSGNLFRSTNNGLSWTKFGSIANTDINSFAISGANILAGTSNGIYRSNNNGNTWPSFNNGLKDNNVYAVGASGSTVFAGAFTGGNIHSSADGGGSWSTGSVNPNYGYYSFTFVRRDKGYIFGTNGAAFRTEDFGASWIFESTYVAGTIRGSFFGQYGSDGFQDGEGWACGDNGVIIKTYDEGRKWVIKNSTTTNTLNSIKFVDSLRGWAFGDRGTILYTLDGGETWTAQSSGTTANLFGSYFQALELLPPVNSSYALLIYAQRRYYYSNPNTGQVNFDVITKTDTGYVLYNPLSLQYFSSGGGIKANPSEKWKISPNGFAVFYSDSGKYYDHNGQVPGNPLTISTPIAYIPDANSFQATQGKDGFLLLQHIKSPVLWTLLPQSEVRLVRYYESGARADSQGISFIAAFDTTKTFYRDVDVVRLGNFQMTPARTQELRDFFFYSSFWTTQLTPYNMYNPLDYNNNKHTSPLPDKSSLVRYANDAGCTTCGAENYTQIQNFLLTYSTDRSFYLVDQPIPGYGSQRSK